MLEAAMLWNEPNNKSHWDPELDPDWSIFSTTVIEAANRVMSRAVSPPISDFFRAAHERLGVRFALGAAVVEILEAGGRVTGVATADGQHFPADLVLVGIGVSAMLVALNSYLISRARLDAAQSAAVWLVGTLNGRNWTYVQLLGVALIVLTPPLLLMSRRLHLLEMGDDTATALGVRVEAARMTYLTLGVALIAVVWFFSQLIRFGLSRSREYVADAGAVELALHDGAGQIVGAQRLEAAAHRTDCRAAAVNDDCGFHFHVVIPSPKLSKRPCRKTPVLSDPGAARRRRLSTARSSGTAATVPSVEPLSTRTTGASCRESVVSSSSRRFMLATTTATSGGTFTGGPFPPPRAANRRVR